LGARDNSWSRIGTKPNGISDTDTFGSQNGLLWIGVVAGQEGRQEGGNTKALFAMKGVGWRTQEKASKAVDFDAFGTPEELSIG